MKFYVNSLTIRESDGIITVLDLAPVGGAEETKAALGEHASGRIILAGELSAKLSKSIKPGAVLTVTITPD